MKIDKVFDARAKEPEGVSIAVHLTAALFGAFLSLAGHAELLELSWSHGGIG
jgi:hypothetical protein